MQNNKYKIGVYFSAYTINVQQFGFGVVWSNEKYIHFNLFNFELAIGKTAQ